MSKINIDDKLYKQVRKYCDDNSVRFKDFIEDIIQESINPEKKKMSTRVKPPVSFSRFLGLQNGIYCTIYSNGSIVDSWGMVVGKITKNKKRKCDNILFNIKKKRCAVENDNRIVTEKIKPIKIKLKNKKPCVKSCIMFSATDILKRHGIDIDVRKFNELMISKGFMEVLEIKSNDNEKITFKSLCGDGLKYGKNYTTQYIRPRTQPTYFEDGFMNLYDIIIDKK